MRRLGLRLVAILTFVFLGTLPLYGVTFDAVLDFSNLTAIGIWSYGYVAAGSADTSGFQEFDTYDASLLALGVDAWSSGPPNVPLIARNGTGSDATVLTNVIFPPNLLLLYADGLSDWPVLRWTAPFDGDYTFVAYMQNLSDSEATVDVALDGALNGPFALSSYGETLYVYSLDLVPFTAGQTLDFVVENGGVGVAATADTPEPASMLLVGLGLAGLGMLRRRARK